MPEVIVESSNLQEFSVFINLSCGKKSSFVNVYHAGRVQVCCKNASHAAYGMGGREFSSVEKALAGYKSQDMKDMINEAIKVAEQAVIESEAVEAEIKPEAAAPARFEEGKAYKFEQKRAGAKEAICTRVTEHTATFNISEDQEIIKRMTWTDSGKNECVNYAIKPGCLEDECISSLNEVKYEAAEEVEPEVNSATDDKEASCQVAYAPLDKNLSHRAFAGTSFDPEKRGDGQIAEHKRVFNELQIELGDFFEQKHADKLHDLWTAYLSSHSNVMSSMITGPSNFPTERNRKKSEWADNKHAAVNEYLEKLGKWHKKAEKKKTIEAAGGELAMKRAELAGRKERHELMKAANKEIRAALKSPPGITDHTTEKLVQLGLERAEAVKVTTKNCYGTYGFENFQLTNSNSRIKASYATVTELERREQCKESNVKPEVFTIPGGEVIFDFAENRANVVHEEKPDREIISLIKKHGFKWSRSYGQWTRKMTANAQYSARMLIDELNSQSNEQ